jgi:hypothetical protein
MGKKWHSGPFWRKFSSLREKLTWQHAAGVGRDTTALTRSAGPGAILQVFAFCIRWLLESVYFSGITGFFSRAATILFLQRS